MPNGWQKAGKVWRKRRYRVETEKSRMAGKRRAKLEKKALPRVETTEKSRMAGKRLAH